MNCPACHLVHPEGARFCLNYGAALATTCSPCGTALVPGAQFCYNYGYALATPQSPTSALVPTEAPSILAEAAPQLPVGGRGRCPQRLYSGMYPTARPQRTLRQSSSVGNRRTVGQADRTLKGLA
jgi:hypothetical protein